MTSFTGYHGALDLIHRVSIATTEEFATLKPEWEARVVAPTKALIDSLGPALTTSVSPTIQWKSAHPGSLSPIRKDARFSRSETHPYKDHLLITFWDGPVKSEATAIRFRLEPDRVGLSVGNALMGERLERWRTTLLGPHGAEFAALVEARLAGPGESGLFKPQLKRPAVDVPDESPVRDLLCHKNFALWWLPPSQQNLDDAEAVEWLAACAAELAPMHRWLVEHVR